MFDDLIKEEPKKIKIKLKPPPRIKIEDLEDKDTVVVNDDLEEFFDNHGWFTFYITWGAKCLMI